AAADAWERAVLPARVERYEPSWLDTLCLGGEVGWARLWAADTDGVTHLIGATPIALFLREHAEAFVTSSGQSLDIAGRHGDAEGARAMSGAAQKILDSLADRGASFLRDVAAACELDAETIRNGMCELVAAGLVSSDGFDGLRTLLRMSRARDSSRGSRADAAGRWSLLVAARRPGQIGQQVDQIDAGNRSSFESALELHARALLRRYGVVFRRVLA